MGRGPMHPPCGCPMRVRQHGACDRLATRNCGSSFIVHLDSGNAAHGYGRAMRNGRAMRKYGPEVGDCRLAAYWPNHWQSGPHLRKPRSGQHEQTTSSLQQTKQPWETQVSFV